MDRGFAPLRWLLVTKLCFANFIRRVARMHFINVGMQLIFGSHPNCYFAFSFWQREKFGFTTSHQLLADFDFTTSDQIHLKNFCSELSWSAARRHILNFGRSLVFWPPTDFLLAHSGRLWFTNFGPNTFFSHYFVQNFSGVRREWVFWTLGEFWFSDIP